MKKLLTFVCVAAMMISALVPFMASAESGGIVFSVNEKYTTTNAINDVPLTFEATINVPTDADRAGVIIGNYNKSDVSYNMEIHTGGVPRFYAYYSSSKKVDIKFSNVNVNTGEDLHLTITIDTANSKAYCYVNGELKQTVSKAVTETVSPNPYMIGGDLRADNDQYFKGSIKYAATYSDLRSADEVKADVNGADTNDENLLFAYDLMAVGDSKLTDLSKNNNDLVLDSPLKNVGELGGYVSKIDNRYFAKTAFANLPLTYEAVIYIPTEYSGRGGVIAANYFDGDDPGITFEVYYDGQPRMYYIDKDGNKYNNVVFDQVDVRSNTWVHLAMTYNAETSTVSCYLNGELKQEMVLEKTPGAFDAESAAKTFGIACDHRETNEFHFKGAIKSVSLFSDVRTPEEIAADVTAVDTSDANLLVSYDLTSYKDTDYAIKDLSANGNDACSNVIEPPAPPAPPTFDGIVAIIIVSLSALLGALTLAACISKKIKNY